MKALVSTSLLVLILLCSFTQEIANREQFEQNYRIKRINFPDSLKTHKLYLGTGFGYPWMFSADITYLSKRNIGFSINYKAYNLKSTNLPSDYESVWSSEPNDLFTTVSALFVFDIRTSSQKLRPGFEAGLSWVTYKEADYQKHVPSGLIVIGFQNYNTTYTTERFMGFQARVKLEVLFNHFLGCEFALAGNINQYRSFVGVEAKFLIGRVREKTIPAH
jgi:hypothetical protein